MFGGAGIRIGKKLKSSNVQTVCFFCLFSYMMQDLAVTRDSNNNAERHMIK